jgi:hypothetical protein
MKYLQCVLLFSLIGVLTSSCELGTELELELPTEKPKLVANCLFSADSAWTVLVFGSLPTLVIDQEYHGTLITNANVKILDGNGDINFKLDTTGPGTLCYRSTAGTAKIGKTYTLEVSAPGYETIRSSVTVPSPVSMIEASMRRLPPTLSPDLFERRLKVTFVDPPNEQNFYAITAAKQTHHPVWGLSRFLHGVPARPTDELLDDRFIFSDNAIDNFRSDATYPIFFDDQFFNGREYTVELGWSDSEASYEMSPDGHRFAITLWSVSEEYYKYRLTLQKQKDQMKDPFAQPVQVYNNIENGFGAFGAYSQSQIILVNVH